MLTFRTSIQDTPQVLLDGAATEISSAQVDSVPSRKPPRPTLACPGLARHSPTMTFIKQCVNDSTWLQARKAVFSVESRSALKPVSVSGSWRAGIGQPVVHSSPLRSALPAFISFLCSLSAHLVDRLAKIFGHMELVEARSCCGPREPSPAWRMKGPHGPSRRSQWPPGRTAAALRTCFRSAFLRCCPHTERFRCPGRIRC